MQTLESLKKRIDRTSDLHSIVKTMKSLAVVNIRRFERAAESLKRYASTVDMALGVVLRASPAGRRIHLRSRGETRIGAFIFGTDQGMCGSLNEQVAEAALETLSRSGDPKTAVRLVCSGERIRDRMIDEGLVVEETLAVPGSEFGITDNVRQMLFRLVTWSEAENVDSVYLFYAMKESRAGFHPVTMRLLPTDEKWLGERRNTKWDSVCLPQFTMDAGRLFSRLIREYFFISLYRAFVESLAAENAARLSAMQGAEKNIESLLEDLQADYHRRRQMAITEELIDIVAGFEALEKSD
jgi:F-type H+-transporting ATPase subunit gamma